MHILTILERIARIVGRAELARALVEVRDELAAAKAALTLTRAIRPALAAAAHVKHACELLDDVRASVGGAGEGLLEPGGADVAVDVAVDDEGAGEAGGEAVGDGGEVVE